MLNEPPGLLRVDPVAGILDFNKINIGKEFDSRLPPILINIVGSLPMKKQRITSVLTSIIVRKIHDCVHIGME